MLRLSRELVEHQLSFKEGFKPYKQSIRHFNPEVLPMVKKEVECLLSSGFIRTVKYVDWLSNIVPVIKKNGKVL